MTSTDLLSKTDTDNALQSLLRRVVPYEKAGRVIPRDLLQFGLVGSAIVMVTGLFALILPWVVPSSNSTFYLVLSGTVASVASLMKTLAIPAIIFGGSLLILDVFLMKVRTTVRWRSVIVVQATVGGVGGILCVVFVVLIVLNLVIWFALAALILMMIGIMAGAMAGG